MRSTTALEDPRLENSSGSVCRTGTLVLTAHCCDDRLNPPTSAWVYWFNTARLMHRLGRIPPTEYEATKLR